jgi:hypothetical protein
MTDIIEELRGLIAACTKGDLSTAQRHIKTETVECPACHGDGEVEAADYCNFDGVALGVQFYGIGEQFGAHEKLWSAVSAHLPALLDRLEAAERGIDFLDMRRPINGIECRSNEEVFAIMADRIRLAEAGHYRLPAIREVKP